MRRYAEGTAVPASRSKAEIERLLERYGATHFMTGWDDVNAFVGFKCHNRMVKFVIAMPDTALVEKKYAQEERRRWRALCLVIKSKLEAVNSEIATFESEFLAHIVTPDGKTVGEHVVPVLDEMYLGGKVKLLPTFAGEGDL